MPELSHEEKFQIVHAAQEAADRGEYEEAKRILSQIPMTPHMAMAAKEVWGKEVLHGFNLSAAEAEYGQNWLNQ